MLGKKYDSARLNDGDTAAGLTETRRQEALLKTGALQNAIFNSANFSSIATDAKGVIQIFNVGAERMLGYAAADVMNKITPADISDPQEVIARAKALSVELGTPITPGFEALGVQGLARHRGHLRADLHPQGRQPLPGRRVGHRAARRPKRNHRLSADRHRQHRAQAGGRGAAQGGRVAERDFQQRQLLQHRHRREGRDPDLQRRRGTHAGLRGRRRDEQDHPGRHFRSAGSDRARRGAKRRTRHTHHAGLRSPGVQGRARHRGHLRTDLYPQGRQPLPGGGVGHGAARRPKRQSSVIC